MNYKAEKRTVEPTAEPVTTAEAKAQAIIETSDYDALVDRYIKAAREWAEKITGRAFVRQTWRTKFDCFPRGGSLKDRMIRLGHAPLVAVSSIQYVDTNGDTQTLAASKYVVDSDSEPARIAEAYGESWPDVYPELHSVIITSTHGYYDPDASPAEAATLIPEAIRQAIVIMAADMFQHRTVLVTGISQQVVHTAESLLMPYSVRPILD